MKITKEGKRVVKNSNLYIFCDHSSVDLSTDFIHFFILSLRQPIDVFFVKHIPFVVFFLELYFRTNYTNSFSFILSQQTRHSVLYSNYSVI